MSNEVLNVEQLNNIKKIIEEAKHKISKDVNTTMVMAYMNIGKMIVEHEQKGNAKAEYGATTLKLLSKELTNLYGRGFSKSNLFSMRRFYFEFMRNNVSNDIIIDRTNDTINNNLNDFEKTLYQFILKPEGLTT